MLHRLNTNDADTIRAVMVYDEYLTKTFNYKDGDIFFDLGSHIGTFSVLMASLNPTFRVYSYEPIPENFEILKDNILLNNLENVFPFQLAISSDSDGQDPIYYTRDDTPFGAAHKFIGSTLPGSDDIFLADRISLNNVFERNNIEKCRLIKTDCEGAEVRGFSTLKREHFNKIDYVIGEFHPRDGVVFEEFFSWFEGFEDISYCIPNYEEKGLHCFLFRRRK